MEVRLLLLLLMCLLLLLMVVLNLIDIALFVRLAGQRVMARPITIAQLLQLSHGRRLIQEQ